MESRMADGTPRRSRPRLLAELPTALELLYLSLDHVFDLPVDETIRNRDHEALAKQKEQEIMENIRFTASGSDGKEAQRQSRRVSGSSIVRHLFVPAARGAASGRTGTAGS